MQVREARSEGLLRVYDVVVPAADLESRLAQKIEEVQPRVRINGFRPGKVPASHIRKMYGPSMMQDIIKEAVQESTEASLKEAKARAASQPQLDLKSDINEVASGKSDLSFELSIELMPDFEPMDPKTISVTKPVAEVTPSQVEEAAGELAASQRTFADKDGAAEDGDAVVLDFVGKIDGEAFEGGSAENATVVIGSKRFIPGFEEQLVGVMAGDERILAVTFPVDYPAENLAGKEASFETTVKQVRTPQQSVLDDDFAKMLGFDGLAALKQALQERIEQDHAAQSRAKAKRALFDELDKGHSFDLPPRMVEAEFAQIWKQLEADKEQGRADPSDAGKSEDDLRAEYRRIAERRVRLGLVLAEIGRRNNVEVNDHELSQAVMAQARRYPGQEQQIFDMYRKNPQLLTQLRAPMFEEKVVDYVLELVNLSTTTVSREALFADEDADFALGG